jgi:hypothetical protein
LLLAWVARRSAPVVLRHINCRPIDRLILLTGRVRIRVGPTSLFGAILAHHRPRYLHPARLRATHQNQALFWPIEGMY